MNSRMVVYRIARGCDRRFSISGTRLLQIAVFWLVLTTTEVRRCWSVVGFTEMLPYDVLKTPLANDHEPTQCQILHCHLLNRAT